MPRGIEDWLRFPKRLHAGGLQPSSARGPVPESPPALTTWTSGPVCTPGGWRGTAPPPVECSLGSGSIEMDLQAALAWVRARNHVKAWGLETVTQSNRSGHEANLQRWRFIRSGLEPPRRSAEGVTPHSPTAPAPLSRHKFEVEGSLRAFGGPLYPQFPLARNRFRGRTRPCWSRLQIPWSSAKWYLSVVRCPFRPHLPHVPGKCCFL